MFNVGNFYFRIWVVAHVPTDVTPRAKLWDLKMVSRTTMDPLTIISFEIFGWSGNNLAAIG